MPRARKVCNMVYFDCPGCECSHGVSVEPTERPRPIWDWNKSLESPTFRPSVLVTMYCGDTVRAICHSFVTDGKIAFLTDSTHELAGQTVELPEFE